MRKHVVISTIGDERLRGEVKNSHQAVFVPRHDFDLFQSGQFSALLLSRKRSKKDLDNIVGGTANAFLSGALQHMFVAIAHSMVSDFSVSIREALRGSGVYVEHVAPFTLLRRHALLVMDTEVLAGYLLEGRDRYLAEIQQETLDTIESVRRSCALTYPSLGRLSDIGFA